VCGWVGVCVGISTHTHPRTHTQIPTHTHTHTHTYTGISGCFMLLKMNLASFQFFVSAQYCAFSSMLQCVLQYVLQCVLHCVLHCVLQYVLQCVAVCFAACVTACVAVWTTVLSCFRDSVLIIGTVCFSFPRSDPLLFMRTKNSIFCFLCAFVGKKNCLLE